MALEQYRPHFPPEELASPREESIFNYYSVENETRFVQEFADLPEEEKQFYVRESVLRFLGEFVGKVPYTRISFLLKPHGLEYAGIATGKVYYETALKTEEASRERDEWAGYREVENTLQSSPGATWISPPKTADYGFVFHFQKDVSSEQVDEYILKYPETREMTRISREILKSFSSDAQLLTTSDFLVNPISSSQPDQRLETLMGALNISEEEIEKSKLFENEIKKRMTFSINGEYYQAIRSGDHKKARRLLTGFFNWAQRIKQELDLMPAHLFAEVYKRPVSIFNGELERTLAYFSSQKATVIGGGSCPITRAGNSTPFSSWNLAQNLKIGNTIENTLNKQTCEACQGDKSSHFHCPGCGGSIESGKGIETCPHCQLNKDDYAKQTGVSC